MTDVVHVVVPAHDEEALLGACLASVATAAARLQADVADVVVRTTVVLDSCIDGTAAIAATYGVDTVVVDAMSCTAPQRHPEGERSMSTLAVEIPAREGDPARGRPRPGRPARVRRPSVSYAEELRPIE